MLSASAYFGCCAGAPAPLLGLLVAGVYLGAAYLLTWRLYFPIALHTAWNLFEGPVFGFHVSGISTPIAGRDGRAYGVLCALSAKRRKYHDFDVSFLGAVSNVVAGAIQRRQLDQRQELMIRELRHRSGNLFSQLLALFSQTSASF